MKQLLLLSALALAACAGAREAVLLPQTDADYKVLAEGDDLDAARDSARDEAIMTCRPQGSRRVKLLEESQPERTVQGRIRVRWRFSCEKLEGY